MSKLRDRLRESLRKYLGKWNKWWSWKRVMALYLALFLVAALLVPSLSTEEITRLASLFLTVEGFLLGLSSQIPKKNRKYVVGVAMTSILASLITIILPLPEMYLADVVAFAWVVAQYARAVVLS